MRTNHLILTTLMASTLFLLLPSDAFALNAANEMGPSVQRLANLLHGNLMHAIMVTGIAASAAMSFFKGSFIPVGVGIGTGVLYGFAHTWIDATFAMCV